jgi:hypothetical protein
VDSSPERIQRHGHFLTRQRLALRFTHWVIPFNPRNSPQTYSQHDFSLPERGLSCRLQDDLGVSDCRYIGDTPKKTMNLEIAGKIFALAEGARKRQLELA